VQLVPIDEAAGGPIANLCVILPAVPQPAYHLDVVLCLVEKVRDELLDDRIVPSLRGEARYVAPAEVASLIGARRGLNPDAGRPLLT
jgi:hypothetical protein